MWKRRDERVLTCSLLATPRTAIDLREAYDQFLAWFGTIACHPTHLGIVGDGFSRKLLSFSRLKTRLTAACWGKISDLTLVSVASKDEMPLVDYEAYAHISVECRKVTLSTKKVIAESPGAWASTVLQLGEAISPAYGYAFESARSFGPVLDTAGLSFATVEAVGADDEEYQSHLPMHWLSVALKRADAPSIRYALRSVYPWQLLTKYQLGLKVRPGQTLQQWIETGRGRGKLAAIDRGAWVWTLASQQQVESARATLYRSGLLWAWWPMDEPEPSENRVLPVAGAV